MPSPAVPLYRVLVEEYASQGIEPPFPAQQLEEEFARRRPALEARLAGLRESDPEEYELRLDAERVKDFYAWLHKNGVKRSALCFSGGGIRSATFGLGLVQALAGRRLLRRFDYLSTVSGGGYLGSWLTGWIYRQRRAGQDPDLAIEQVESQLRSLPESPLEPEPEPLRYLRSYSRYMSPKLGLLSADTWTLVAIFLRNLFLNWLVLLPLMAAVLMIPRISVLLVRLAMRPWFQPYKEAAQQGVFWAAVVLGACAIAYIGANRPSLGSRSSFPERLRSQERFLTLCLLPLALMAILITLYWAWVRSSGTPLAGLRFEILGWETSPLVAFTLFGVLLHVGGFLLSRIWAKSYVLGEFAVVVLTGALGGFAAWLAASRLFPQVGPWLSTELYVTFAAPLLLSLFLIAATFFVGIASYFTNDADREWLARCGAWVLIAIAVRMAFSALVIFGPVAVLWSIAWVSSIGSVSGLLTLLLGGSGQTKGASQNGQEKKSLTSVILDKVLVLAAPVFAASIFVALSLGTTLLIWWLAKAWLPHHPWSVTELSSESFWWPLAVVYESPAAVVGAVLLGLVLLGTLMGVCVDINRFSLHAGYRDRLIRAYLGASRGSGRRPNPFTGFDEDDNVQMKELRGNRPFHVVNMALNLVAGKNLAWQDRKAQTFTASPLHAGSFRLGYRDVAEYGRHRGKNQHVALSLGTAVAISGAAASPNAGYHSSPVVTFLLALFNVRLGWWLGNPGPYGDSTFDTPGPRFAPRPFFSEAFGLTDSQHPYVYLSDGGHFENLALYEMILRRCHFIVLSDGGQDPDFTFEDLGNALSKARVDLGVPIKFEKILLRPRSKDDAAETYDTSKPEGGAGKPQPYCAIARICYSCVDSVPGGKALDGLLLYLKPSLNGTEPADVFHYARLHPLFPHEPTSNQLYTESQFESYRELGAHAMRTILAGLPDGATLEELFKKIEGELGSPPSCA
jgi:patatin-like phospholipase